jgi:hypothetical protein
VDDTVRDGIEPRLVGTVLAGFLMGLRGMGLVPRAYFAAVSQLPKSSI